MINRKEAVGIIFFLTVAGVIAILTALMDRNQAAIADLKKTHDSQEVEITNLIYQLNQCKTLHVEGRQLSESLND